MTYRVTVIPGDGIGPEVTKATTRAIDATGVKIQWEQHEAGLDAFKNQGSPLPQSTIDSIKDTKVALKGPTTTPVGSGHKSVNVALRQELDLYACIRPIKSLVGVPTRFNHVDIVIFRENTEGLYTGQEIAISNDLVLLLKISSEPACTRIARAAFEYAKKHGRKKVTAAHKANIIKLGDGLFLRCARKVAEEYPEIQYEEVIIDALCMHLVTKPERFDIIVLENLYGDIVSDLCAGLVGGLGVVPGSNIGQKAAIFEAVHGSAPDIAGKGIANPTALMQSGVMMLEYLGEMQAAAKLQDAIHSSLANKNICTVDLGGCSSSLNFTDAVIAAIQKG